MILGLALEHLWLDVGICWNQCYLPATCQQENHPGKPIYNFSIGHSRGWPNKSPSPDWAAYTRGHHQKLVDVMNIQAWPLSMIHLERLTVLAPLDFLRISARQINPLTRAGWKKPLPKGDNPPRSGTTYRKPQQDMVSDGFWDEISILSFIDRGKQAMTKNTNYLPGPRKAEIAPCVWASKMRQEYPEDLRKINDLWYI